jgi:exopolyphosphatase/guanosine-5'-triphosphate,3'-diphosphate pyrophosphatase
MPVTQDEAAEAGQNKLKIWPRRAVIDIGSNSVRLVIYDGPPRTPLSIFNEKALCGLGRRAPGSNAMLDEAMAEALTTLRRFKAVWQQAGEPPVTVFATAACRDASNGAAFLKEIEKVGFSPVVLSGEEEARFAALGVLSAAPEVLVRRKENRPHLAGDMGGGSLELVRFAESLDEPIEDQISLPLGPFRVMAECGPKLKDAEAFVQQQLDGHEWLAEDKADDFYTVGGAWRAIAKLHMAHERYPLPILHHYEIPADDAIEMCRLIEAQSEKSLLMMPGMQAKRVDTLPHAAMVLRLVMQHTRAKKMIVSAAGVREGILFDPLADKVKERVPFLRLAFEYGRRYSPEPEFGHAVFNLTDGIFRDEAPEEKLVRHAACLMCDVASLHHPEMRAEYASGMALQSPFIGVDHPGRVALAAVLYQRHFGRPVSLPKYIPAKLMSERLAWYSQRVGMAIRFVADFSPKSAASLKECRITHQAGELIFTAPKSLEPLMGDTPRRRFGLLSEELGLDPVIKFLD